VSTDKFYNYDQMADLLGCTQRTVANLLAAGRIPKPVRLGRLVRWPVSQVDEWIADGCPEPSNSDCCEVAR